MSRPRYKPHLSWCPIVPVRWRSDAYVSGKVRRAWTLYLFGVLPIARLPRRKSSEAKA